MSQPRNNLRLRDKSLAHVIKTLHRPGFCEAFAHFVRNLASFDNLIIIAYYRDTNPVVLYRQYTDPVVYTYMDSDYLNAAYLLDPFYHAHRNGLKTGLHRLFDIAPDQFKRTSYFNVYYQKTTLIDEVAAFADLNRDLTVTACFGKDRSSGQLFSKQERERLRQYESVICTLMEEHWRDYQPDQPQPKNAKPLVSRLIDTLRVEQAISLTARQAEVAMFILQGHSSISISLNLGISPETVKVFRKQLYAKCQISSQAELFALLMPVFSRISAPTTSSSESEK
ncbi:helix-turn-helix transcriptional regulator [Nitrincola sp.]|uniref:helix-turn-helix transcriptional regulator n=1 Tax=Nitrincola sp. TaxID=1926584 RepID=UPI003A931A09